MGKINRFAQIYLSRQNYEHTMAYTCDVILFILDLWDLWDKVQFT